jgi:Fic family protein
MKYLDEKLQKRIDQKLTKLNQLRPIPKSSVTKLRQQFQLEMTYNSNAIEGNSLTLKETFLVINEGITVKGKALKDHLEAKDHHDALEFLYDLVEPQKKPTLSEHLIRQLHQLVMKKSDEKWAGKFRNSNVIIAGSTHTPPSAPTIKRHMEKLVNYFKINQRKLHSIELAAIIHHKLVYIHPFLDGNGRSARLVMNLLLMRKSYPLSIILKQDRQRYYHVLSQADVGSYSHLVRFIALTVERSLDIYLNTLTPSSKQIEKFISLSQAAKHSPYSTKYLNLLARLGKLEAHKQGRNWLTSIEAVNRYIKTRQRKRYLKEK